MKQILLIHLDNNTKELAPRLTELKTPFLNKFQVERINLEEFHEDDYSNIATIVLLAEKFNNEIFQDPKLKSPLFQNLPLVLASLEYDTEVMTEILLHKLSKALIVDLKIAPALKSTLEFLASSVDKTQLENLQQYIYSLKEDMEQQFGKIKSLHNKLVPKRFREFKKIKLYSKYGVGQSGGSEFFDILEKNNKLLCFLSSADSYLSSGPILEHFSLLSQMNWTNEEVLRTEMLKINQKIHQLDIKKNSFELLLLIFDLNSLEYTSYNFGRSCSLTKSSLSINSNNYPVEPAFFETTKKEGRLEKNDKIVFLSPGFKKGSQSEQEFENLLKSIQQDLSLAPNELISEIFSKLPTSQIGFLNTDSISFIIEVTQDAIYQI